MTRLGLRIDIDTLRGTRKGVPRLLQNLQAHGLKGTFFFSVGPDNMGRHLWRLLKPTFLAKMLRSKAASLYGWDILLRGTFLPGPHIGQKCSGIIGQAAKEGHEIGLHAWDHQRWQAKIDQLDDAELWDEMSLGWETLKRIIGRDPDCSAAPGWRMNDRALSLRDLHPNRYNSDCRGRSVFLPQLIGGGVGQPQVPTTLPTYDEWVGPGRQAEDYYRFIQEQLRPERLNVLTIHAEVEGIVAADAFDLFLHNLQQAGIQVIPLGELLPANIPRGHIAREEISGREGWLAVQEGLS